MNVNMSTQSVSTLTQPVTSSLLVFCISLLI